MANTLLLFNLFFDCVRSKLVKHWKALLVVRKMISTSGTKRSRREKNPVVTEMVAMEEEEEAGLEVAAAGSVVIISGMKHNRSPLLS